MFIGCGNYVEEAHAYWFLYLLCGMNTYFKNGWHNNQSVDRYSWVFQIFRQGWLCHPDDLYIRECSTTLSIYRWHFLNGLGRG